MSLKTYWYLVNTTRQKIGKIPSPDFDLFDYAVSHYSEYGFRTESELKNSLENKDFEVAKKSENFRITNIFFDTRMDGNPIGGVRNKGEVDYYAYSPLYASNKFTKSDKETIYNPSGFYLVLNESGGVEKVPYDLCGQGHGSSISSLLPFVNQAKNSTSIWFPSQAHVPFESMSFEEDSLVRLKSSGYRAEKIGVEDNGGPESLVQLSRRQSYPNNIYGIDRKALWKQFDPAQPEFTLSDIQAGATKLGLDTRVQKLTLAQLQASGSAAALFLKDDGRIVTLTALDDDRAVVIDRGLMRNVERSVLEGRYSDEALVPTKSLTQSAGIVADDAVRSVQLPSLDAEVPQSFTLRNTGKTPLTLQLEYPLLGVTDSKLSKDTLAPGESATLDLKVKWRSILKAPSQNVLVSLQTGDPIVPRLQLAILLNPPKVAGGK